MKDDFERNLEQYAEVIVKVGLNLQAGQRLLVRSSIEAYPLVRRVTKTAYQAGALFVDAHWSDDELDRIRVQYAALETMSEFASWQTDVDIEYMDRGDAWLRVVSSNPDLMDGLDPQKISVKLKTEAQHRRRVRDAYLEGATNWSVAGASAPDWAAKVFPELAPDEAVSRLWDEIFKACRIGQADPVSAWQKHIADLQRRKAYLSKRAYAALKYTGPGTDLTIGLPAGHIWQGGHLTDQHGRSFTANLPTEEVFTIPHKDRIDGVVTSSRPLSAGGRMVENFTLEFAAGQVMNATAETGQTALDDLLNVDPGARSLGEVALVPHSSPISQTNLLFFKTLFDENASSHLALGDAIRFCLTGGDAMTAEEFAAAGGNCSMVHVDFMIGNDQMDIDGITGDGAAEPIMRGGEWAFEC